MSTHGLLLAAGAGRRMGGPKALVRPAAGDPTLVETAVSRLRAAGLESVLVVVGAAADEVAPVALATGAGVVAADDWDEGMGASLRAGLRHLEADPGTLAALVMLVDLPDVGSAVHRRVLDACGPDPEDVLVRATYHGSPGHPVLLGRHHWAGATDSARGDRGARQFLATHGTRTVECGDLADGGDVDTPDALGR